MDNLIRTEKLIGTEALEKLKNAHVLIVGIGGVGGSVFEMLVRTGVGHITVLDGDCFDESNLNRQILSKNSNIGYPKVQAAFIRAQEIDTSVTVTPLLLRYNPENKHLIWKNSYDYIADCIDSLSDKADLIISAKEKNIKIISAMGAGNRTNPNFKIMHLCKTTGDGLAKALRHRLKDYEFEQNQLIEDFQKTENNQVVKRLKTHKVVCDEGLPMKIDGTPASISYAPNLMGMIMAGEIIRELISG